MKGRFIRQTVFHFTRKKSNSYCLPAKPIRACARLRISTPNASLRKKKSARRLTTGLVGPPEGVLPPLPEDKPYTIRFRSPQVGTTVVEDLVKGDVIFDNRELDDLIIARTDGTPTYNFCVVIDDIEMNISHIIRGDDHLANTPRQIQLYRCSRT